MKWKTQAIMSFKIVTAPHLPRVLCFVVSAYNENWEKIMNIRSLFFLAGITSVLTGGALADDHETDGHVTAKLTFASIDQHSKGYIHQGDLEIFRDSVFAGMDKNEDGAVTYPEFRSWDPGFSYLAEEKGKVENYNTAIRVVFAFWDRDGDGKISTAEMRHAMNADMRRADLNDDAVLTEDEFLKGFTIIVAVRAAFRPDIKELK